MRRNAHFWCAVLAGSVALAAVFLTVGREPDRRRLSEVIPPPPEGAPYFFVLGRGGTFEHIRTATGAQIENTSVADFLALLSVAERAVLLAEPGAGRFSCSAAAFFPRAVNERATRGATPEAWSAMGFTVSPDGGAARVLRGGGRGILLGSGGAMTLLASDEGRLGRMLATLEGTKAPIDARFDVEPLWPNHLRFFDGGLFAHWATLSGFVLKPGALLFDVAWKEDGPFGRLRWKMNGLSALFPDETADLLQPVSWSDALIAPRPLLLACGISPGILSPGRLRAVGLQNLAEEMGLERGETMKFLSGPTVVCIGGSARFLVFSLPGMILQFPDRGKSAHKVTGAFWNKDWNLLVPAVERIDGYESGGTASTPFSLVGLSNAKNAIYGVLDRAYLAEGKRFPLRSEVPVLREFRRSVAWLHVNTERFDEVTESLTQARMAAEKFGAAADSLSGLYEALKSVRRLGTLSVVLPTLDEGVAEWTSPMNDPSVVP